MGGRARRLCRPLKLRLKLQIGLYQFFLAQFLKISATHPDYESRQAQTFKGWVITAAALSGVEVKRAYVDRGYVGHGIERDGLDITISHTRGITSPTVRREMRRRNGIEPVIGHMKDDGLLERNQLAGAAGDAANVILCAAGHNMRLLARWLRLLLLQIWLWMLAMTSKQGDGLIDQRATPTIGSAPDAQVA